MAQPLMNMLTCWIARRRGADPWTACAPKPWRASRLALVHYPDRSRPRQRHSSGQAVAVDGWTAATWNRWRDEMSVYFVEFPPGPGRCPPSALSLGSIPERQAWRRRWSAELAGDVRRATIVELVCRLYAYQPTLHAVRDFLPADHLNS